ncbi:MAG: methylglyoxal synthase [Hyphomicrobiales bacterium]|jgi:methylglyoxal synthase
MKSPSDPVLTLAFVAHDAKKEQMVEFAKRHAERLRGHRIVATGTTGGRVKEAAPHLPVQLLKSGPLGGDQQIGALIAENGIDALFFLVDPLSPMPHDVDVKALMRLALVYNVPMALNLATAEALLTDLVATVPDR